MGVIHVLAGGVLLYFVRFLGDGDMGGSKNQVKCPSCGQLMPVASNYCGSCGWGLDRAGERAQSSLGGWFGLLIILGVLGLCFYWFFDLGDEPEPPKTAAELRVDLLSGGFSPWDGSHYELVYWLKSQLKDPGSYEHINTTYRDNSDHLMLYMRYRAKNSFGGYSVGSVSAKAAISGELMGLPKTSE